MGYQIKKLSKKDFPSKILEISDPPKELFIVGSLPPKDYRWLCVVGSRKYTSYGKIVCEKLVEGLRGFPIAIVSGLALGIDSIAHRTALSVGLQTIAVPGSGLSEKVLYPRSHFNLANEIIEKGGALISEFEPEFKATPWSFPQRNRIMVGLSDAILLIEAEEKSGTLITARLTSDYNRELMAVPGSIFSAGSSGTHMFLRLGATLIRDSKDILEVLGLEKEEVREKNKYSDCSEKEMLVIKILKTESLPRDEIVRRAVLPISEIQTVLTVLELKKLTKEEMGEIRLM